MHSEQLNGADTLVPLHQSREVEQSSKQVSNELSFFSQEEHWAKRPDNGVPLGNSAHPNVRTHLGARPCILRLPLVGRQLCVCIVDTRD